MMRKLFQSLRFDRLIGIRPQTQEIAIVRSNQVSRYWPELDVLRGIAAVSMILNHLGYRILNPEQLSYGLTSHLVFMGSFAPVLFFFITGVGYGVQSKKPPKTNHLAIVLNKFAILILADSFMHWSTGRLLGLDFFGFIGIACIVLEMIKHSRRPIIYALIGLVTISGLRYGIGPHFSANESLGYGRGLLGWVLGTFSPEGISYPLSPWMVYPLLGYIVGCAATQYSELIKKWWLSVSIYLFLLAIPPLTCGMILANKGAPFFRWGTVSLSYYIVSFTAILMTLSSAILICKVRSFKVAANNLSLPGIASFAIVPIHYFLIYLLDKISPDKFNSPSFYAVAIISLTISFLIAKRANQFSKYPQIISHHLLVFWSLVGIVILSGTVVFIINKENLGLTMLARTLGQTTLCLLFAIRRN
jgi:uncharacterized membrane protein